MQREDGNSSIHRKGYLLKACAQLFLLLCLFVILLPVLLLPAGMFMDQTELKECLSAMWMGEKGYITWHLIPEYPSFANLKEVLLESPEFYHMFFNSCKLTGGILIGQLLVGMPAAWGLARYSFPGKQLLLGLYVLFMMMPFQVLMLSEYLVIQRLQLMDTMAAVILPGMFGTMPVFLMYRFFADIPQEILEAARMDGCGEFQIFCQIGIPLGKPGILSATLLSFLDSWALIEQPQIFLESKSRWPLSLFIIPDSPDTIPAGIVAAVVTILPPLLYFLSGRENLEQGIACFTEK